MDIKKLTREEKEALYIEKMTKLQLYWKNPVDNNWDFSDWADEQLDKGLEDIIGQLRFEMFFAKIRWIIKVVVISFLGLGIIGLLVFGIKQLF